MKSRMLLVAWLLISLTGCSTFNRSTPTPLPTISLDGGSRPTKSAPLPGSTGVTASGVVAPAQDARLVFVLGGKVKTVHVATGDDVKAGQALVELEGQESLEAAVSTAQYEVMQAQQALDDLDTQAESDRIQALQDIIVYEKAVRDAQYALDNFTIPTNQANLDTVDALNQMKQRLAEARAAFEPYKFKASGDPTREKLKDALDAAQADYNAAVRRLQYEYDLEVAQAHLTKALSDYDVLKAGPDPAKVQLAQARLDNAQTQLSSAQAALDQLTLTAPFDGTIGEVDVHSGEWVIPGQPVLVLADLSQMKIETTDLSERDVPKIAVNQPVNVFIKALNQQVSGHVSNVAPLAETLGGDVVYQTTILLDSLPPDLRAGMSVVVQF